MMHPGLRAMLTDTVSHAVATGQDDYGEPLYAPAVPRAARVEYTVRRITNAYGAEVISRCRVFLDETVTVQIQDTLRLDDGTAPTIQLVYPVKEGNGSLHHTEVWL